MTEDGERVKDNMHYQMENVRNICYMLTKTYTAYNPKFNKMLQNGEVGIPIKH